LINQKLVAYRPKTRDQQLRVRSRQSRRGVVCSKCGYKGEWKQGCPNCEQKRLMRQAKNNKLSNFIPVKDDDDSTINSLESNIKKKEDKEENIPEKGLFWGKLNLSSDQNEEKKEKETVVPSNQTHFNYFDDNKATKHIKSQNINSMRGIRDDMELNFYATMLKIKSKLDEELLKIQNFNSDQTILRFWLVE